jgi:hydroxymethylpyrimidine pyrophosphatase-like HAD family hydrolase
MRYTAVALDFDGTIAHDSEVPAHVVHGLKRLKASGRALLLVTGRELPELLEVFPDIAIFDRVVAENGALLYRPESGERKDLGDPPPQALVDLLRERGVPISVGDSIIATVEPHETVVLQTIRDLGLERPVIFNKGAVMILPPGINKASGLAVALHELGLSARNVVAAGDAENDHALLEAAEYSVAVANAIATLKAAADRVTREPRGDGILEIIADLIESDLERTPPARQRRTLLIGTDATGKMVTLPTWGVSMLVTGREKTGKSALVRGLLERLCNVGYQFCVVDGRGEYLDFEPAIVFGTEHHAPDPLEVFTALEKPEVQAVVCLAAVPAAQRPRFFEDFDTALRAMRERTGRPHWLVIDEAQELVPRSRAKAAEPPGDNTIYVTSDPTTVAADILSHVSVVAACGDAARQSLERFAEALGARKPAEPLRPPGEDEALLWFHRLEQSPALVRFTRGITPKRTLRGDVGRLLRHG